MIGEKIRDYIIESELGRGGFGAVYRAKDTSVDRTVAIKVILPKHANDPDFKRRFDVEARLVAQLESLHIVPLYSYWHDEHGAFLVMRDIRGGTLRAILQKQGKLSLSQTVRILSHVADALSVAHENGVIHRDLKPENILLDERGNAYLTDFGIAKIMTTDETMTPENSILGTLAYLAPEQLQRQEISVKTDCYTFGTMLYEMLVGEHPFAGSNLVMSHLQAPVPDVTIKRPDLPPELNETIARATEKDPDDRFDSISTLMQDLNHIAKESSGVIAAPIPTPKRNPPTSPEQRNRYAMFQNMRTFWIEGVLENSLQQGIMLDLNKSDASHQIENPWHTVVRTPTLADDKLLDDNNIRDIFEQMNGKLLILGDPGGGKTTTMLELTRLLLLQAELDDAHPMPVVFNLSSWAERQLPLTEWLINELGNKYQVPRKVATQWVEDEDLILMLDGLDEVTSDARDACLSAINAYRLEHGFVDMVVCSRIHDYEALSERLLLNGAVIIQPLSDDQIDDYLFQIDQTQNIATRLLEDDQELRNLARSPLMLNIIIQAYQGKTSDELAHDVSPDERQKQIFGLYVENTLQRRGSEQSYSLEETTHYLHNIAHIMQKTGQSIFNVLNATPQWLPNQGVLGFLVPMMQILGISLLPTFLTILVVSNVLQASSLGRFLIFVLIALLFIAYIIYPKSHRKISYKHIVLSIIVISVVGLWVTLASIHPRYNTQSQIFLIIGGLWLPTILFLVTNFVFAFYTLYRMAQHKAAFTHLRLFAFIASGLIAFAFTYFYKNAFTWQHQLTLMMGLWLCQFIYLYGVGELMERYNVINQGNEHFLLINKLTFDRDSINPHAAVRTVLYVITCLLILCVVGLSTLTMRVAIGILVAGGVSAIFSLFQSGLTAAQLEVNQIDNHIIQRSFFNALWGSVFTFLVYAMPVAIGCLIVGLPLTESIIFGICVSLQMTYRWWAIVGGTAVMALYQILNRLKSRNMLPHDIPDFLDHATRNILMRRVGTGYIFIHRYLLEYFAELESPSSK